MRSMLQAALAALLCLFTVTSLRADLVLFDVDAGNTSSAVMDGIYQTQGCGGIASHMAAHPIPVGAVDVANGHEIVGWEVVCEGGIVARGGSTAPFSRTVVRACGYIRLYYAQA